MADLPTGTVTFLFTDIEGSTRLLQELGDGYADVLAEHRRVLREAFARRGGVEVDTQGDAFFVAFARAKDALAAAADAQAALTGPVRVRMGLHTGEPLVTDEGYVGIDVHRAARIAAVGHGGQVLLSRSTGDLVGADELRDLGEHRLKDLTAPERIYQLGETEFPPLKSLYRTNLPVQPSPLVGRERELAEVMELVRTQRLVTLTGAGGTGKTRLALQAAAELAGEFADGVWFVSLAALADASLVEGTISSVVGAKDDLAQFVRGKQILLVLDNLEQLLPDIGPFVARLEAKVIATSRERLNVSGEHEYEVQPLSLDDAVALFTARARQLKPQFEPDEHVTEIGRRLDGLPLALELAAARVKVLSPEQILDRLAHGLELLRGGAGDLPERQRTLRATIDWSYELLEPDERRLFERLSVFPGSMDVHAAEAVAGTDVDTLAALVDKSLLRPTDNERFFMLETIREYAGERLSERGDEVADRHARYFHDRAVDTLASKAWDEFGADEASFRASFERFVDRRSDEDAGEILMALTRYWNVHWRPVDSMGALESFLSGERKLSARCRTNLLLSLGYACNLHGSYERARGALDEALEVSRRLSDRTLESIALMNLGWLCLEHGVSGEAAAFFEQVISADMEPLSVAGAKSLLAAALVQLGDVGRGRELAREAVATTREFGTHRQLAEVLENAAETATMYGDYESSRELAVEGLALLRVNPTAASIALHLLVLADSEIHLGRASRAAHLLGAFDRVRTESEVRQPSVRIREERAIELSRSSLGDAGFATAWTEGAEMTLGEVLEYALAP